jgi:N-acetylglucosaminyldiphosphoundecaprenol N-acetyl-beta-D-mannosaminyltransferase
VVEPGIPGAVEVLGVRFQALMRGEAAEAIAALAKSEGKSYVVKPYSEFLPRAARDERVRAILRGAQLCLADGVGILWAAHYLSLPGGAARALIQLPLTLAAMLLKPSVIREPIPQAMAGVDLTWEMLGALDRAGLTLFLLGGSRTEVAGARRAIEGRLPQLRIVGAHPGHFVLRGPENDEVISQVSDVAPDVLLVGMGFPRQEIWIAENLDRLNVRVAVAEGGSFTFIAGAVSRAPGWMRRAGLEWLFRLARQPWRLRRQLALPVFVWLVLRERLSRKA